jgi:hypothetical protein
MSEPVTNPNPSPPDPPDDLLSYVLLEDASNWVPGRPHRATLWRWATHGVHCGDRLVQLQTLTVGGRRYTTPRWIGAFIAACNMDISDMEVE